MCAAFGAVLCCAVAAVRPGEQVRVGRFEGGVGEHPVRGPRRGAARRHLQPRGRVRVLLRPRGAAAAREHGLPHPQLPALHRDQPRQDADRAAPGSARPAHTQDHPGQVPYEPGNDPPRVRLPNHHQGQPHRRTHTRARLPHHHCAAQRSSDSALLPALPCAVSLELRRSAAARGRASSRWTATRSWRTWWTCWTRGSR